jgi:hypothetical protein
MLDESLQKILAIKSPSILLKSWILPLHRLNLTGICSECSELYAKVESFEPRNYVAHFSKFSNFLY